MSEASVTSDHLGHVVSHLDRLRAGGHADPPLLHHRPLQQDPLQHGEVSTGVLVLIFREMLEMCTFNLYIKSCVFGVFAVNSA